MKSLLLIVFTLAYYTLHAQEDKNDSLKNSKSLGNTKLSEDTNYVEYNDLLTKTKIIGRLKKPLGDIMEVKVIIIDGDKLNQKATKGIFLLQVLEINKESISNEITFEFEDESGSLPMNDFELNEHLYKKKTVKPTEKKSEEMKNNYVGNKYTLLVYETGKFVGLPKDYYKYAPMKASTSYHFKTYLQVIKNLTISEK